MRSSSLRLSIRRRFHRTSYFSYWKNSSLALLSLWSFLCWYFPVSLRLTLKTEWTTAFPIFNKCKNGWSKRFSAPNKHMLKYISLGRRPLNRWYDRQWIWCRLDWSKLVSNHPVISSVSSTGNDITWSIWPCKVSSAVHQHRVSSEMFSLLKNKKIWSVHWCSTSVRSVWWSSSVHSMNTTIISSKNSKCTFFTSLIVNPRSYQR